MKKQAIPALGPLDQSIERLLNPIKQNLDAITGRTPEGEIDVLPSTASLAEVIAKVNEIVRRLNGSGT